MENKTKCFLCEFELETDLSKIETFKYKCPRCGWVYITREAALNLRNSEYKDKMSVLSGITRYRSEYDLEVILIGKDNIQEHLDSFFVPRNNSEQLDLLLKYISKQSSYKGEIVDIDIVSDFPIAFCKNYNELEFFLKQLESQGQIDSVTAGYRYILTMDGWNRIDEIDRKVIRKNQAFIAMWFDDSMSKVYQDGFHKAIKDSGYEPMKINLKEHNNKIDDEIIAEIRNSGFLVADFTGHRGGVYYEAGFAHGLGIPVIWTCRKEDITNLHFDTRQYNHIEWETTDELYKKLVNRIKATITI
ncbi:MAG: hypothetical protein M3R36_09910 [Bacteroidota bacterium]|nr:hypothetical protein [Bacteroidota bacterium]